MFHVVTEYALRKIGNALLYVVRCTLR